MAGKMPVVRFVVGLYRGVVGKKLSILVIKQTKKEGKQPLMLRLFVDGTNNEEPRKNLKFNPVSCRS